MSRLALVVVIVCIGCRASGEPAQPRPARAPAKTETPMKIEKIQATTVATINGWRVGVGNLFVDKYKLADGTEKEGLTAHVHFADEKNAEKGGAVVGEGSVLDINGQKWRVLRVAPREGDRRGHLEIAFP
jgi:hypothetical protein